MPHSQYHLLKTQRFLPLFITQFFNAFNDNAFKNAFVILITYKMVQNAAHEQFMIAYIGGVFILPFFLFSATAGQVADKFEKSALIRIIKAAEIFLMLIASLGFYFHNLYLLMVTLFCLGTHSTFFGPIKYAILPDHLSQQELIGGNALIEAGTFLAILIGQVFGGMILGSHGLIDITIALLLVAVLGWLSSLFIPPAPRADPNLGFSFNIFKVTFQIIRLTHQKKIIFLAILGISWFWFIGATFITQFPTFTKVTLQASASIFTLFLTVFSVGVGVGSLFCNKLLKGKITAKYVPLAMIGMSIFMADSYLASGQIPHALPHLLSLSAFFQQVQHVRILIDIFLLSFCGGLYIVPLYAIMQEYSEEAVRSRVIACNNIINSIFMVGSSLFVILLTALHFSIPAVFLVVAVCNLGLALFMRQSINSN